MNMEFTKFPSTPHLIWMSEGTGREDKVLSRAEAESFLRNPVFVEEKVDGANLGISFDQKANLRIQNRGTLVERGSQGQFAPLWAWLSQREEALLDVLEDRFILFGEWCYARHSIHYTMLPDYFLAFDVFDIHQQRFMSSPRRDELVDELNLFTVPKIDVGVFNLDEVIQLITKSSLYDGLMEGIYLRQECTSWLLQRTKIVREEFVQQIGQHWSRQPVVPNALRR